MAVRDEFYNPAELEIMVGPESAAYPEAVDMTVSGWSRQTVADGQWLMDHTVKPLESRDVYLANCIDETNKQVDNINTVLKNNGLIDDSGAPSSGAGGNQQQYFFCEGTDSIPSERYTTVSAQLGVSFLNGMNIYNTGNHTWFGSVVIHNYDTVPHQIGLVPSRNVSENNMTNQNENVNAFVPAGGQVTMPIMITSKDGFRPACLRIKGDAAVSFSKHGDSYTGIVLKNFTYMHSIEN